MTVFTFQIFVPAFQQKTGRTVVERGIIPARRIMAYITIQTQLPLVSVIFQVTGLTRCRRHLQIGQCPCRRMARCALDLSVFPDQGELMRRMIKVLSVGIHPIVARQTIHPK